VLSNPLFLLCLPHFLISSLISFDAALPTSRYAVDNSFATHKVLFVLALELHRHCQDQGHDHSVGSSNFHCRFLLLRCFIFARFPSILVCCERGDVQALMRKLVFLVQSRHVKLQLLAHVSEACNCSCSVNFKVFRARQGLTWGSV